MSASQLAPTNPVLQTQPVRGEQRSELSPQLQSFAQLSPQCKLSQSVKEEKIQLDVPDLVHSFYHLFSVFSTMMFLLNSATT